MRSNNPWAVAGELQRILEGSINDSMMFFGQNKAYASIILKNNELEDMTCASDQQPQPPERLLARCAATKMILPIPYAQSAALLQQLRACLPLPVLLALLLPLVLRKLRARLLPLWLLQLLRLLRHNSIYPVALLGPLSSLRVSISPLFLGCILFPLSLKCIRQHEERPAGRSSCIMRSFVVRGKRLMALALLIRSRPVEGRSNPFAAPMTR